jgi:Ca2+ transporting ATPase
VQFGSIAFHVAEGGLSAEYWGMSLAFGVGSFPVQQLINVMYRIAQHYKGMRIKSRVKKDYELSIRKIGNPKTQTHLHSE